MTILNLVLNLCFSFLHSWQVCRACAPLRDDSNLVQEANEDPADKTGALLRLVSKMRDLARLVRAFRRLNQARRLELVRSALVGILHMSPFIGYGVSDGVWFLQVRSLHARECVKLTSIDIGMRKYDRILDAPWPRKLVGSSHLAEIKAR